MPGIHELVTPASLYSFIVAGVLLLAWEAPLLGNRSIAAIELAGARFAARKKLAIFLIALLPILLRVLLLPIYPLRPPGVQDEFSYLFAADTFAHGHLANPPNPMWVYFDTIHILQHPVVASKYPPGQGAVLALGQLLGHPWIGVLLSMGAMFGALLWMLQGWFPAKWALLGAVLALLRFGVFSYWMNSYLGGAVAAFGGALVMGAYPRWLIHHRRRYAFILGVGAAILANSRPFEGFVLCVPVSVALMWWLSRNRDVPWREVSSRLFIPLGTVMLVASSFTLYYDWRITGNPFLFPHSLDTRIHSPPPFLALFLAEFACLQRLLFRGGTAHSPVGFTFASAGSPHSLLGRTIPVVFRRDSFPDLVQPPLHRTGSRHAICTSPPDDPLSAPLGISWQTCRNRPHACRRPFNFPVLFHLFSACG